MENTRKPCLKCLLSEIDPEAYMRDLRAHIDAAPDRDKTPEPELTHRLAACKQCDFLESGTCRACGCFVELRAAFKRGRCPYKKW